MGRKTVVTSGKGGVGKTTVTSGLGIALSDLGHKVCMVDADIGLNNLDVVMCVENLVVYDILDVATGKCRLRQALVQDRYNPLLYVLPSSKLSDAPELTPQTFSDIVNSLAENFEYVLIDCPAGIEGGFHRAVSSASEALVVTTPTVSAIRDADKVLNLLEGYPLDSIRLIVNRLRNDMVMRGEMMNAEDITRLLRCKAAGIIPEDDTVTLYSGVDRLPKNAASGKAFRLMAAGLMGGNYVLYDDKLRNRGLFGFIKRKKVF